MFSTKTKQRVYYFQIVERRVNLLAEEGINFVPNTEVGKDISGQQLLASYDAILLAIGSTVPRDLQIPGKLYLSCIDTS